MKILVVHGEGLGNIIQILPLIATLRANGHEADLMLSNSSFDFPDGILDMKVYKKGDEVEGYDGKIETIWGKLGGPCCTNLKLLNVPEKQQMRLDMSEVQVYLGAAIELGIHPENFVYDCKRLFCVQPRKAYDVVFSNGYNWKMGDLWVAKSWKGHGELARRLGAKGLRCCSIGTDGEGVLGTDILTGGGLRACLELIRDSRMVVSNDSGFYHCACAMGVATSVIFTFTSVKKNRDCKFHAASRVFGRKMDCRETCHRDMKWQKCQTHECRDVSVDEVFEHICHVLGV